MGRRIFQAGVLRVICRRSACPCIEDSHTLPFCLLCCLLRYIRSSARLSRMWKSFPSSGKKAHPAETVSYTHLDVYKRQSLGYAAGDDVLRDKDRKSFDEIVTFNHF